MENMKKAESLANILLKEIISRMPTGYSVESEKRDYSFHMDIIKHFSERAGILKLIAREDRFGEVIGLITDSELEKPIREALEAYSEGIGVECKILFKYKSLP